MGLLVEILEVTGRSLAILGAVFAAFSFFSGSGLVAVTVGSLAMAVIGAGMWFGARWLRSRSPC
jgi:hypothetical protein